MKLTKVVTFNPAADLLPGPATLVLASSDTRLAPAKTTFDAATERTSLTFAEDLPVGTNS